MIPILAGLLASLAGSGINLIKGAIESKGKEAVENLIGAKIPDNPSAEDLLKLKQLEMEHEEALLSFAIEQQKLEIEEFKLETDDKDSSRDREIQIAVSKDAPLINKIATPSIAMFIVLTWAFIQYYLMRHTIDGTMRELIARVLGTLDGALMLVLSYYFGASHNHTKDHK